MNVESGVKEAIIQRLGCEATAVRREASLTDDLCADSLDLVELTALLEEKFRIVIPESQADKLGTVGHLIDYITSVQRR